MTQSWIAKRIAQWKPAAELVVLLVAAPVFLFMRPVLTPALALLPILWLLRYRRQRHFIPRTPVDWPILGLALMALVSLLVTPDPAGSLAKVAGLLYAIALFYALVDWGLGHDTPIPLATLVVGVAAATALLSLFGTQWTLKWSALESARGVLPTLIRNLPGAESGFNPNTVSGTLITFVPLQVALLWGWMRAREGRRAAAVALTLVATLGIVILAQSRAGWAALLLCLLVLAGLLLRRWRAAFLLLAVACVLVLLVAGPVAVSEWLTDQGLATSSAEASWTTRNERWSRWLWGIADHPLSGSGMDVFRYQAWDRFPFFHTPLYGDLGHAHQTYLHTAMDLGLPGLIAYLALLGSTLVLGVGAYRRAADPLTQLVALGGVVGLAAHALWGMVDVVPLGARTNFAWWTVAALVITVVIQERRA